MNLLLFPSKLKNKVWLFVSVFIFLNLSPNIAFSEIYPTGNQSYTCKVNQECLDELNNKFLNKKSQESLYHICSDYHKKVKNCCASPNQCNLPYAKNITKDLDSSRSNLVEQARGSPLSCQLNRLSNFINSLSESQNSACNTGLENCNITCQNELEFFKSKFRQCFFIQDSHRIDSVLKQAQANSSLTCWSEINKVADKYTKQSFDKKSLFNEDIKAIDIIDCNSIERFANKQNLNNLALNVCYQAKAQQEQELQQQQQQVKDIKPNPKEEKYISVDEWEERQKRHLQDAAANSGRRYEEEASNLNQKNKKANQFNQEKFDKKMADSGFGLVDNPDAKKNTTNKTNSNIVVLTGASLVAGAIGSNNGKNTPKRNQATNQKTSLDKTNNSSLTGSHLKLDQSGSCLVNMPEMKPIVFQSVEAPQIDSLGEQDKTQTVYGKPDFKKYVLVQGKSAGILVKLRITSKEMGRNFKLNFTINGKNTYDKCFSSPFHNFSSFSKLYGRMFQGSEQVCELNYTDLKTKGDYKFFPLPMEKELNQLGEKKITVRLSDTSNKACYIEKDFTVQIKDTLDLNLGFTRTVPDTKCYTASTSIKVQDYVQSEEIKFMASMFPLNNITAERVKDIIGSCNTRRLWGGDATEGLVEDIDKASSLRDELSKDQIVIIIPHIHYVKLHRPKVTNPEYIAGFVVRPHYGYKKLFRIILLGDQRVMFVVDNRKDKGTTAHELAHSLGQLREFYEKRDKNNLLLQKQEQCQQFNGSIVSDCFDYKIPRALYTGENKQGKFWQFISDRWPFMNSKGKTLNEQWISRETFQKAFSFLHDITRNRRQKKLFPLPEGNKIPLQITSLLKDNTRAKEKLHIEKRHKVAIMGVYNHIRKSFDVPRARTYHTRISTLSFPKENDYNIPVLTFQLKEGNKILKEIYRPILKMEIETFYRNKAPETEPFYFSRMRAFIDLPKDQRERDLKVVVLSSKGKTIYSSPVSKEIHKVKK